MSRKNGHRKLATATIDPPADIDLLNYGAARMDSADPAAPDSDLRAPAPPRATDSNLRIGLADTLQPDSPAISAMIELPIGEPIPPNNEGGYKRRFHKVELRLSDDLAPAFRRLYYALHDRDTRLASGRHIDSASDVIRYILEQYDRASQ
jgi:hypothetical protein